MSYGWKTAVAAFTGFIIFSFAFATVSHFTVGQELCELSKSGMSSDVVQQQDACKGLVERWTVFASSNPLNNLGFWISSAIGAAISYTTVRHLDNKQKLN